MSKSRIFVFITALLLLFTAAGCEKSGGTGDQSAAAQSVIVTTDALYEIVSTVAGDKLEVTKLLSGGEEIHHFEPTARDAEALAEADLIICNGLGLDDWAAELAGKTDVFAAAGDLQDALIEGDPHVWLSPKFAAELARSICTRLSVLSPENADAFALNCSVFYAALEALSYEFAPQFAEARLDTFVTGHAAFAYLAAEFNLTQKSVSDVFSSSEPTAQQLMQLADFCNDNGVKYVLSESAAPLAVSETLAKECGAEVLPVYMMESSEGGLSFVARMRSNLEAVLLAVS